MTNDQRTLVLVALAIAFYYFFVRKAPASASTVRQGGAKAGCGCSGTVSAAQQTAPPNPQSTWNKPTLTSNRWGRASGDNAGAAAPGGNIAAAGSGSNYQGIGGTTYSPNVPTGSTVWQANSTPVQVAAAA